MKSVRIRSYSGPRFPTFELYTVRYGVSLRIQSECGPENADQNNSEYGHFLLSDYLFRKVKQVKVGLKNIIIFYFRITEVFNSVFSTHQHSGNQDDRK